MKKLLRVMVADLYEWVIEYAEGKRTCRLTSLLSNRIDKSIKRFVTYPIRRKLNDNIFT